LMKKIFSIFFIAFVLNAVWENLHSVFYDNYMGGEITQFILLRASFWDAIIVVFITLPFIFYLPLKNKSWLIILAGIVVSIFIEYWGLGTGRWAYNSLMPIIPLFGIGLTPAIQLGLLGYISFKTVESFR
jgi:hypothetical protein